MLLSSLPAVVASFAVLTFGGVGTGTWLIHLLAIFLSGVLALAGGRLVLLARISFPAVAVIALSLASIALPLLYTSAGPSRWVEIGPLSLYMAPVVIPSFLVASAVSLRVGGNIEAIALTAIVVSSLVLAVQPDASQALAMLLGSVATVVGSRFWSLRSALTLMSALLVVGWAFSRPDPLQPVPYVEGVFALAFNHSLLAGIAVAVSAITFVAGLCLCAFRWAYWLSPVAAYYTALFACSIAELTPAPLVGFGAGPLLGFGLVVIVSRWATAQTLPNKSNNYAPAAPDAASRAGF
jgi:hypothetical protein